MPLKTLLGLIVVNLIWSFHPTMGKLVLADFSPAEGAWLRYGSALAAFALFYVFRGERRSRRLPKPRPLRDWALAIGVGVMAFCVSPLLQLTGLEASRATDNALIIAMEPLITVLMAWILLRERVTRVYLLALAVALGGFALLAGVTLSGGMSVSRAHLIGDLLMLASLLGEALYSVGGRSLVNRDSPISIFGIAIFSGVLFLSMAVPAFSGEGPLTLFRVTLHQLTWRSALALLWLGPLGTTAAYLYWIYALKEAPVAGVALTLFIQPVFGAFWGYEFLGERLSLCQSLGGVLIIAAVFSARGQFLARTPRGRQSCKKTCCCS